MSRPPALVVMPRMPWPLDDGGRIGLWQMLWSVSRGYATTLVTLESPDRCGTPVPDAVAGLAEEVIRVPHAPPLRPVAVVRGALGRWPYTLVRYRNRRLAAQLERVVTEKRPRFALVNHLHLATYFDVLRGTALVLREHNVEHLWLERLAETRTDPLTRLYVALQARRMKRTEAELCRRADLVLAVHDGEAEILRRLAPEVRVETVPVGIELARFEEKPMRSSGVVLLVASFRWPPNVEGALAFLGGGWPRVRARVPGARLRLVGTGLPQDLANAARAAGAEPVGYVERAEHEFASAAVMVVPLWTGAGARVKVVEGLAARVPIVSTSLGVEGLGLEPGTHFERADTPDTLGEAVADLLLSPHRAAALASAGRRFAEGHFCLAAVARRTVQLCAQAAEDAAVRTELGPDARRFSVLQREDHGRS